MSSALYLALPFSPWPPAKLSYLLDRLVEHESLWSDYQVGRREVASGLLARSLAGENEAAFEVWKPSPGDWELSGLVLFTGINPKTDASGHFLFFDGRLKDKTAILLNLMVWAFNAFDLHRLSAEIPDYAYALVAFARKRLGFRFEAEGRKLKRRTSKEHGHIRRRRLEEFSVNAVAAESGSRKYQAILWRGEWHDLICLSITREEFEARHGQLLQTTTAETSSTPRPPRLPPADHADAVGSERGERAI